MGITADISSELLDRIEKALDAVRPYLHSHGGDVSIVTIRHRTLHVKFQGACVGCPISLYTLTLGIEEQIKQAIPEIDFVVAD